MQDTLNQSSAAPVSASIDIADVLRGMRRRKRLVFGMTLAAFVSGLALVNVLKPIYTSEAQVLIDNLESPFDRAQAVDGDRRDTVDDRVVISQMAVLRSQDLGRRVIAALKLTEQPEFNSLLSGGLSRLGEFKLALGFGEDPREKTPEQRAMGRYLAQLSVYDQPQSNVIAIKYTAGDPKIAANVANALAEMYVTSTRESQSLPTGRARDWLAEQIADLRRKVAASEAAVERFRTEAGLLQGTTVTLGTQEVSELNTQITLAQAARTEAQVRAESIRQMLAKKGTVDASSDVLASGLIQNLKEQQAAAARLVAELSAVYLPNHPKMIAAKNQLDNTNRQIRGEVLKVVQGLEQQAQIAAAREQSLRAGLESLKSKESGANLEEVKLKALERDASADRVLLESMLSRFADASARQDLASQPGMARIIQSAAVPSHPSFPKRGPVVLLITIAGLSLGLGLAFLIEIMAAASRLSRRLHAAPEEEAKVSVKAATPVPPLETKQLPLKPRAPLPAIVSSGTPAGNLKTTPADLAPWATDLRENQVVRRFAVTSIGGNAGDSSLATLAFARALAASGHRVIVADAAAGSILEQLCAVRPGPGITELAGGKAGFTKVIKRDSQSMVHLLRFGLDRSAPNIAATDSWLEVLFGALAGSYDMIVVHAGEASREKAGLMRRCEAAIILAAPARNADAAEAARSLQKLGLRSVKVIGIAPADAASAAA